MTFRLLEASALKAALAKSPGVLAVITSSWFFEEVVRHCTIASAYQPVDVAVKETTTIGWICLPDHVDPGGQVMLQPPSAVGTVPGGLPTVALRTLPRDTAAFTGRTGELDGLEALAPAAVPTVHATLILDRGKAEPPDNAARVIAKRFGGVYTKLEE